MFCESIKDEDDEILEINSIISFDSENEIIPFYDTSFIDTNSNLIENIDENSKSNTKNNVFIIIKDTKTFRGRKTKRKKNSTDHFHDKYSSDNILRKIKIHFLSFIIYYANIIINVFPFEREKNEIFKNINSDFKKNVNKDFFKDLKDKDIGYILKQKISSKFKKNHDFNKNLFNRAIKNADIKYLFSEKILSLFNNIYYKNIRKINYNQHSINLSNAKMFKDLLKKVDADVDTYYINRINECIKNNFK